MSLLFVITISIALFMLALIIFMSAQLRKNLRVKFYSYTNIGLISGLIFLGIFFITQVIYIIRFVQKGNSLNYYDLYSSIISFPSNFSYLAVPVIVIISAVILVSNIALIRHEGFRVFNLLGAISGGAFAIASLALDFLGKNITNAIGSIVNIFAVTLLCYFECVYFSTIIMAVLAVRHRPKYDKDFMIILGCSIDKRGGLLPLLKSRTNRAIKFAWEQEIATGKSMRYIPSGGQGPNEVISEGSAMELYLLSHGAEEVEVLPEKKSRNTYENFAYSRKIVEEQFPDGGAKVAFATTNYHILRSGILARYAGLDAEGIASDTKWYFWPNGFVREFIAIIALKKKVHIKVAVVILAISILLGITGELLHTEFIRGSLLWIMG